MRYARIIDKQEDLDRLSGVLPKFFLSYPVEGKLVLQGYENLRLRKWKETTEKIRCGVFIVCLEDEGERDIIFDGFCLAGYYSKVFNVTPEGKMSCYSAVLESLPPFEGKKYGSFLIDSMLSYLDCMGISNLEFEPSHENGKAAFTHRGYKKCEDGIWRKS